MRLEKEDSGTHITLTFKDVASSQKGSVCVSHSPVGFCIKGMGHLFTARRISLKVVSVPSLRGAESVE